MFTDNERMTPEEFYIYKRFPLGSFHQHGDEIYRVMGGRKTHPALPTLVHFQRVSKDLVGDGHVFSVPATVAYSYHRITRFGAWWSMREFRKYDVAREKWLEWCSEFDEDPGHV